MSYLNTNMNRKINIIKLFCNNDEYSKRIQEDVKEKLIVNNYTISNDCNNIDLAIAIGGDGAFIRMIKECNFDEFINYIGINTGTLGFAQEIFPNKIDSFINNLNKNKFKIEKIGVQQTKVKTKEETTIFYSLNEIVIREKDLNTAHLKITIDNELLEDYCGDGILISTSFGSTAYNLSYGGSIVYNDLHTLQITPIAPLNNKNYSSLNNSIIIPEKRTIELTPLKNNNLIIHVDGVKKEIDNVSHITTFIKRKKINLIRMKEYDYTKKINEKFIK